MPWNINLQVSRQICFLFNHINSLLNANPGIFNCLETPRSRCWMCVCGLSRMARPVGPEDHRWEGEEEREDGGRMKAAGEEVLGSQSL